MYCNKVLQNAQPLLFQAADEWPPVRMVACEQLGTGQFDEAFFGIIAHTLLERLVIPEEDHRVRQAALQSLSRYGGFHENIVPQLLTLLADEDIDLAFSGSAVLPQVGLKEGDVVGELAASVQSNQSRAVLGLMLAAQQTFGTSSKIADAVIEGIAACNDTAPILIISLPSIASRDSWPHYATQLENLLPLKDGDLTQLAWKAIEGLRDEETSPVIPQESHEPPHLELDVDIEFNNDVTFEQLFLESSWRGVQATLIDALDNVWGSAVSELVKEFLTAPSREERRANAEEINALLQSDLGAAQKADLIDALKHCERLALPCLSTIKDLRNHEDHALRLSARYAYDVISTSFVKERVA